MSHLNLILRMKSPACREQELEARLARLAGVGPAAIQARIEELDREWSAGRIAKAILSIAILVGTILTVAISWWWVFVPAIAGLFLLQYLFAQKSALVSCTEWLGYRTRAEIEHEKFALRTLRGDFRLLPTVHDIEDSDDISRLEGEGGIVVEIDDRKVDAKEAVKEVLQATTPVQSPA